MDTTENMFYYTVPLLGIVFHITGVCPLKFGHTFCLPPNTTQKAVFKVRFLLNFADKFSAPVFSGFCLVVRILVVLISFGFLHN